MFRIKRCKLVKNILLLAFVILSTVVVCNTWNAEKNIVLPVSFKHSEVYRRANTSSDLQPKYSTTVRHHANNNNAQISQSRLNETTAGLPKTAVNVFNNSQAVTDKHACVKLSDLKPKVDICIHDSKIDQYVSGHIAGGRFWEPENVRFVRHILSKHPDLHVIDIGANLGQYTLLAAHQGRNVLAVEARLMHVQMIHHSVVLNGFEKRVTLVHNALSDKRTTVYLGTYAKNQGGTFVKETTGNTTKVDNVTEDMSVQSILMGDLASVANFSKAMMKIDIEGFEDKAMRFADPLFDKVFIPLIMMEWNAMKNKPSNIITPMLQWLQKRQYEAVKVDPNGRKTTPLQFDKWQSWGFDVAFKHKSITI